jgi:hypothetical protein
MRNPRYRGMVRARLTCEVNPALYFSGSHFKGSSKSRV